MKSKLIYQPSEDSFLLEKYIKKFSKGKKVLDMGSGSGIQSFSALKSGAESVLAVDINEEAVKRLKKQGLLAIKSDLFSKVKGKFDLIVFNPPYLPEDKNEDYESRIITSGGKSGDEIIIRFLEQAKKHLEDNGEILLLISSITPFKRIEKAFKKIFYKWEVLESRRIFMESLSVLKILNS